MSAKSPSSKSRGCLVGQHGTSCQWTAYLFWFLILAILHRKIYVTDNNLKRLGRREVKRQERNQRVVLDLMDHQHKNEKRGARTSWTIALFSS